MRTYQDILDWAESSLGSIETVEPTPQQMQEFDTLSQLADAAQTQMLLYEGKGIDPKDLYRVPESVQQKVDEILGAAEQGDLQSVFRWANECREYTGTYSEPDNDHCFETWGFYGHNCVPLPKCVMKYFDIGGDTVYHGICWPVLIGGAFECRCFETGIPLAVLMALIAIGLVFFGGPIVSGLGAAAFRRIAQRAALAGIA